MDLLINFKSSLKLTVNSLQRAETMLMAALYKTMYIIIVIIIIIIHNTYGGRPVGWGGGPRVLVPGPQATQRSALHASTKS